MAGALHQRAQVFRTLEGEGVTQREQIARFACLLLEGARFL